MDPLNAEASGAMDAIVSTVPLTPAHLVAMAAGFLTVGYFLGRTSHKPLTTAAARGSSDSATGVADGAASSEKRRRRKEPLEVDRLRRVLRRFQNGNQEVLVVGNDLKMGKGKIAAQCSHATLGLYCTRTSAVELPKLCKGGKCVGK